MKDESKDVDFTELFGDDASETEQYRSQGEELGIRNQSERSEKVKFLSEADPGVENKCKYCDRLGRTKLYTSHYTLVKHMRKFHAEELEGNDRSILVFTKRSKRKADDITDMQEEISDNKKKNKVDTVLSTSCSYCPNVYSNRMTLLKHLRTVHKDELTEEDQQLLVIKRRKRQTNPDAVNDIYSRVHDRMCIFCWKEFDTVKELETHQKIHDDVERPYLCPFKDCGVYYKSRHAVREHQFSHTKVILILNFLQLIYRFPKFSRKKISNAKFARNISFFIRIFEFTLKLFMDCKMKMLGMHS